MLYQVLTSDGKDKCNCNCNDKSRSLRDDNKRTSNDKDKDKDKETKTRQQTATTATVLSVNCDVPKSCYIEGKCLPTGEGNCLALVVAFGTWFGLFL